jgi:branched-chain amino acid transport system substrate-binding protein
MLIALNKLEVKMKTISKMISFICLTAILVVVTLIGAPVAEAAKKPIVVGVLSWMDLDVGKSTLRGAQLAAEMINAKGGILGRPIKVISADTKGLPDEGVKGFEYLVTRGKADIVTGIFADAVLAAVIPRLDEYKVPLLTTADPYYKAAEMVHENYDKYKGWFRVMPMNDYYLGMAVMEMTDQVIVKELGWNKIVIFREKAAWTEAIVGMIKEEFPKMGIEIKDDIVFPVGETNFSPYYRQAVRHNPDMIFALVAEAGISPVLQYVRFKPGIPLGGIITPAQVPEFLEDMGGDAGNIFTMTPICHNAKIDSETKRFIDLWTKKFKTRPTKPDYAGIGTSWAVEIYAEAAKRAGTLEFNRMVTELEKTDLKRMWRIQFFGRDEKDPVFGMNWPHDLRYSIDHAYSMLVQWQGKDMYAIWPDKFAVKSYVNPPWMKKQ